MRQTIKSKSAKRPAHCCVAAALAAILTAGCASAQSPPAATASSSTSAVILGTEPVSFPAYETVRNLDNYATPEAYRKAVDDRRYVMERLTYKSDGLDVYTYLYRPASVPRDKKLPVIVFNRGSWIWKEFHAEYVTMANRLAEYGYLVVMPMYRGSGGAKGRDEVGGADLNDLFNVLPVIRALPYADADQLYLYGESRGGMMVYQALRDGFPAKAAAVVGAFTDMAYMLTMERHAKAYATILPELASQPGSEREANIERRSAIKWVDRINVPVLILQGGEDRALGLSQIFKFADEMYQRNKPFELVVMQGEGHVLTGRFAERDQLTVRWFRNHARPGSDNAAP